MSELTREQAAVSKAAKSKFTPSVLDLIDRAIHQLSAEASGTELGSVEDSVSRELAKTLLKARELGETLRGILP